MSRLLFVNRGFELVPALTISAQRLATYAWPRHELRGTGHPWEAILNMVFAKFWDHRYIPDVEAV